MCANSVQLVSTYVYHLHDKDRIYRVSQVSIRSEKLLNGLYLLNVLNGSTIA
jgi:hypothetical protein